jgi:Protein of unknown function (DUF3810)
VKITARAVSAIAIVLLALLAAWAPTDPALVEDWFSTRTYPAIQHTVTPFSNVAPVAAFDVLSITAAIVIAVGFVRAVRASRAARRPRPLLLFFSRLAVSVAAAYLGFLLLWGLNYRRVPMEVRLSVAQGSPSSDAVVQLGVMAVAQLNALHDGAHQSGWPDPLDDPALLRAYGEVQQVLSDAQPAVPGRLKRSLLGPYFRWTSVDGMINPFGLEVLVNPDLLPFERAFVAAHEWAHLAGYADESEASFVGWLTCLRADSAAQYSGWLALYWQVIGEVGRSERSTIDQALGEGPRRDITAIVERIRQSEQPWLRNAGWRVYDQYLKANRVEEGIRSYGTVLTLILGARFDEDWTPIRRDAR